MHEISLDYNIPKEYRGLEILLPKLGLEGRKEKEIKLKIPADAYYLDINPLEDEEEFLGNQDESDRQQLLYYNSDKKCINIVNMEHEINTGDLMSRLEIIFYKNY